MKLVYTIAFLLITACILTHSQLGIGYSLLGLNLWFEKMIPALFPFMILSGIMIRMRLTENFSRLLYPVIRPVYKVSRNACYAMIMGFFCGFPMGAKTIADLSKRNMLSAQEAEFLLAFCNNIGPVYFCGFVLPLLGRELLLPYVFGMYGIPLIYGFLLRKTLYRHLNLSATNIQNVAITEASPSLQDTVFSLKTNSHKHAPVLPNHKDKTSGSELSVKVSAPQSLLYEIDDAVNSSIQSILSLGGYMILFNLAVSHYMWENAGISCTAFGNHRRLKTVRRSLRFIRSHPLHAAVASLWRTVLHCPDQQLYQGHRSVLNCLYHSQNSADNLYRYLLSSLVPSVAVLISAVTLFFPASASVTERPCH